MSKKKSQVVVEDVALVKIIEDLDVRSQHILKVVLPQKTVALTTVLEEDKEFRFKPIQVRCEIDYQKNHNNGMTVEMNGEKDANEKSKKRKLELNNNSIQITEGEPPLKKLETQVDSNPILVSTLNKVKLEIIEFIDSITTLKIWVHMHVPKIEDGNNFGVAVQEEVLQELGRCEDFTVQSLAITTKYFLTRAKIVAKCLKYPGIQDFEETVHQLDEKTYIELLTIMRDLRNNYAIVYDFVQKNKDKILCPRSSYTGSMF
jgi:hypothetical protein